MQMYSRAEKHNPVYLLSFARETRALIEKTQLSGRQELGMKFSWLECLHQPWVYLEPGKTARVDLAVILALPMVVAGHPWLQETLPQQTKATEMAQSVKSPCY